MIETRKKVVSLKDAEAFPSGAIIVQAHGVFDLLHLGHVRHLEAAKAFGDFLIVSVTSDRFVGKGPGRPAFTEDIRAETLAALSVVDLVVINDAPNAVPAIEVIRPDVFAKGPDYLQHDLAGNLEAETAAVAQYGGRIEFTHDITFSSSELINRHIPSFTGEAGALLDQLRSENALLDILELIERVRDYRVVLVGDAIIDDYQYVLPMGKSPKENVIATRYQSHELFAGGVFAAANHVASFCRGVDIITSLSDTDENWIYDRLLQNIHSHNILNQDGVTTTLKQRFIDPSYMRKLFEVYYMDDSPLNNEQQDIIHATIKYHLIREPNVVIAADFGHGLIGPNAIALLTEQAPFLAVNCQSNSANLGFNLITKYPRADYICIDEPEARLALGDRTSPADTLPQRIDEAVDCPKIIITQGKAGCITYDRSGRTHSIPAYAKNVVDTVGAGDAFLSVTAPLVAAGGDMRLIGFIGNVVGALKVEIVGHRRSITKTDLIKAVTALLR